MVEYRREVSYSFSPNLLRGIDQRGLELEYSELCRLLFVKERVNRIEKWRKLKLKCQPSRAVWRKQKTKLKNENGGGHPFEHRRKRKELTKLGKFNCLM